MNPMPPWLLEVVMPLPDDSSDLRQALQAVAAMWARGDHRKALLWLRQSVETARGDLHEDRAAALARALLTFEQLPPPLPTGPQRAGAETPAPSAGSWARATTTPLHGQEGGSPAASALAGLASDTDLGFMPSSSAPGPAPQSLDPSASTTALSPEDPSAPSRPAPSRAKTLETPIIGLEPMRALRVAVRPKAGRQWVVEELDDGQPPPSGAQEAFLFALRVPER